MIKDTVQLQGFPKMKLPKIKGEVEIKLHNPTTGKTEIQKGENMVTNAVADIFAYNHGADFDYRKVVPVWQKMYGGILCFAQSLDVSSSDAANDYFIPDNEANSVTAHAGQNAYTDQADDTSRGSPSSANMSINDGTVTLSWEWGLSSGNGPISALALTHTDVGDAGTGSTSNAFKAMKPVINASYGLTLPSSSQRNIMFTGSDGYGYRFLTTSSTITIDKIPIMNLQTGLIGLSLNSDPDTSLIDSHTISLTSFTTDNYQPFYCYDWANHNLWLFYSDAVGRTFKYAKISLTSWTVLAKDSITTDSESVADLRNGYWTNSDIGAVQLMFDGTYVYFPIGAMGRYCECYGLLKMKLPPNHADQTKLPQTAKALGGLFYTSTSNRILVGDACVINNNNVYASGTDVDWDKYGGVDRMPLRNSNPGLSALEIYRTSITGGNYYPAISKFYLGTKYNLQTPVQKTPSQSMLITYTLTEVAPNE